MKTEKIKENRSTQPFIGETSKRANERMIEKVFVKRKIALAMPKAEEEDDEERKKKKRMNLNDIYEC